MAVYIWFMSDEISSLLSVFTIKKVEENEEVAV